MTPSELKHCTSETHFFDRKTMQFFGDTMQNYGVRAAIVRAINTGDEVEVWELYRKRPVRNGLKSSAYFRKDTFNRVFPFHF